MTRTFKRGYVEKGWCNSITGKWVDDEYEARAHLRHPCPCPAR